MQQRLIILLIMTILVQLGSTVTQTLYYLNPSSDLATILPTGLLLNSLHRQYSAFPVPGTGWVLIRMSGFFQKDISYHLLSEVDSFEPHIHPL